MRQLNAICTRLSSHSQERSDPLSLQELSDWSVAVGSVIHVAVMVEPYLDKVCNGHKYIESRLTKVNMAPYGDARPGDVVLFKKSGGPIVAAAAIDRVLYREATGLPDLVRIADEFKDGLGYEQGYVEGKALARFVSLMWLADIRKVASVALAKQSRQAWLTVRPTASRPTKQMALLDL